nr:hypothetical protein CFP56_21623 [Quercus suber]
MSVVIGVGNKANSRFCFLLLWVPVVAGPSRAYLRTYSRASQHLSAPVAADTLVTYDGHLLEYSLASQSCCCSLNFVHSYNPVDSISTISTAAFECRTQPSILMRQVEDMLG